MFVDEARRYAVLDHENIGRIFDFETVDGKLCIILEYIDGWSLIEYLERHRELRRLPDVDLSIFIASRVCRALQYVFERSAIVHRDISPSNIMMTREGTVKLIDFGIATQSGTRDSSLTGKPAYMAPEMVVELRADNRSDLFSLGTVLFEMLTNERLFQGKTTAEVLEQVIAGHHPSPRTFNPAIPDGVMAIVRTALQRDATRRYASAGEMGAACEHFLYDKGYGPDQPHPEAVPPRALPGVQAAAAAHARGVPAHRADADPDRRRALHAALAARRARGGQDARRAPQARVQRRGAAAGCPAHPGPRPRRPSPPTAEDATAAALTAPVPAATVAGRRSASSTALLALFVTSGPVEIGARSVLWRWFAPGARLRDRIVLRLPAAAPAGGGAHRRRRARGFAGGRPPGRLHRRGSARREWSWIPRPAACGSPCPRAGADGADVTLSPTGTAVLDGIVVHTRPEMARAVVAGIAVALIAFLLLRARARDEARRSRALHRGSDRAGLPARMDRRSPGRAERRWPASCSPPPSRPVGSLVAPRCARASARPSPGSPSSIAAGLFGCWVRAYFLPSAGSWDVDFWRTAILNGSAHGYAHTYGGPDDVPEGHLGAQLTGKEPVSLPSMVGRPIVVNYPPLTITMWTLCWRMAERWGVRLESIEAQALAIKVSPVAGDFLAVAVLLWIHRGRPWRAATLAALYWATPVSWLSGAVLGYQDGAYAPLAVIALAIAAAGHGFWAGAALGVAMMVKLQALLLAPAVAGALIAGADARLAVRRLAAAAAGGLTAIALAFSPFALAGTLPAAVVHVNNSWLPGPTSGGSPNIWWLVGHVMTTLRKGGSLLDRVRVHLRHHRRRCPSTRSAASSGSRPRWPRSSTSGDLPASARPCCGGATVFFSYAMLATGAYENHIHTLFLLLLAGGLVTRRCRVIFAGGRAPCTSWTCS